MTPPRGGLARTVLVTGAAGGIGSAIAHAFVEHGDAIIVSDLAGEPLEGVAAALEERGGDCVVAPLDLSDLDAVERFAATSSCLRAGVDVLVNSAGLLLDSRIAKTELSDFERLLRINLLAPMRLMHAVIPAMRRRGQGRIVNITSRAWLGTFGSTSYTTAKGGLAGITRSLALELGHDRITVNAVAPGFIETGMTEQLPDAIRERVLDAIPVGRPGRPEDVARAVAFFADPAAGYITGQTLLVCGGRSIGVPLTG